MIEQGGLEVDEQRHPGLEAGVDGPFEGGTEAGALELDPETLALCGGEELTRHLVSRAPRPASKRLKTDAPAARKLDDRLVVSPDPPTGDQAFE